MSTPVTVTPRHGEPRTFPSLATAKAWATTGLRRHKDRFALHFASDTMDSLLNLIAAIEGVREDDLKYGPITHEGIIDKHTGTPAAFTFQLEGT